MVGTLERSFWLADGMKTRKTQKFVVHAWKIGKREQAPEGGLMWLILRNTKAVALRQGFNKWSGLYMWEQFFTHQMANPMKRRDFSRVL